MKDSLAHPLLSTLSDEDREKHRARSLVRTSKRNSSSIKLRPRQTRPASCPSRVASRETLSAHTRKRSDGVEPFTAPAAVPIRSRIGLQWRGNRPNNYGPCERNGTPESGPPLASLEGPGVYRDSDRMIGERSQTVVDADRAPRGSRIHGNRWTSPKSHGRQSVFPCLYRQ